MFLAYFRISFNSIFLKIIEEFCSFIIIKLKFKEIAYVGSSNALVPSDPSASANAGQLGVSQWFPAVESNLIYYLFFNLYLNF